MTSAMIFRGTPLVTRPTYSVQFSRLGTLVLSLPMLVAMPSFPVCPGNARPPADAFFALLLSVYMRACNCNTPLGNCARNARGGHSYIFVFPQPEALIHPRPRGPKNSPKIGLAQMHTHA